MRRTILAWVVALAVLAGVASGFTVFAQGPGRQAYRLTPRADQILFGSDIGFKLDGVDASGNPKGQWMVRLNGQWREISNQPTFRPLIP